MKTIICTVFSFFVLSSVSAQNSCESKATEKKLNGAAKTSFIKKCEKDVQAACENDDISKRTSGAAKEAHIKKCLRDNLG